MHKKTQTLTDVLVIAWHDNRMAGLKLYSAIV